MDDDKLFSGRKIRVFFRKESIFTRCFGSVVAHFCQCFAVTQFGDLIDTIPRSGFGWLHTVGSCRHVSKFNGIFIGYIGAQTVVCIIVCSPSCHIHVLGCSCTGIDCGE